MKVYLAPHGTERFAPVPGPGDLAGRTGTARIVPEPADSDRTRSAWTIALGNFALRGGSIQGRPA